MTTSKTIHAAVAAVLLALVAGPAAAQNVPTVGGAPMYPDRTIPENASTAPNLSTLVAAATQADLVGTLGGDGPFTVFAPTNDAFAALPAGTVDTLMQRRNRGDLATVLTYHVVAGNYPSSRLAAMMARSPDGLANLRTVEGGPISVGMRGRGLAIYDESGNRHAITQTDVTQANGVVHVIDGVLLPN